MNRVVLFGQHDGAIEVIVHDRHDRSIDGRHRHVGRRLRLCMMGKRRQPHADQQERNTEFVLHDKIIARGREAE